MRDSAQRGTRWLSRPSPLRRPDGARQDRPSVRTSVMTRSHTERQPKVSSSEENRLDPWLAGPVTTRMAQ